MTCPPAGPSGVPPPAAPTASERSDEVAADGSPVAVYRALPAEPSFTPVLAALRPPARVLDLGCGAGRLANLLAARGFAVTGVDASPAMLAGLAPSVRAVEARIEDVRLPARFDVVVMASQLVNDPDPARRRALLATARDHLAGDGALYLEHLEADLLADPCTRDTRLGPVHVTFRIRAVRGRELDGEVGYDLEGRTWTQRFTSVVLDDAALMAELRAAGLTRRRRLTSTWLQAGRIAQDTSMSSALAGASEVPTRPTQEKRP